jgi:alanyl-tRNA synthetase
MEAAELRSIFLAHFAERGHTMVPSSSLIPHDPTLLFTIAGMVPFKPFFAGDEVPPYERAASIQKCFRVPDIDQIGTTTRHLTFFEMMGNFSFGDYFKPGAIEYAWSLITGGFGLDPDRLWVTIHESDDEAETLWREIAGLAPERIQRLGSDNFWEMGDTGPCGPSSEIFVDKGPAHGADGGPAHGGEERYVEIWNLVFMQYDRVVDGTLHELPKNNIDTGSGFERTLSVINGHDSVFATDLFVPLFEAAQRGVNRQLGEDEATDIAIRRIAEHGRAMTMLVADGVLPSNEGRGYVLRRVIRRAVLSARRVGSERAFTTDLVAATIEKMGDAYPVLVKDRELIESVLAREEEGFSRTLRTGLALLQEASDEVQRTKTVVFPGDVAFRLHDTHGFPFELTEEIVAEMGLSVDRDAFRSAMDEQRARARAASKIALRADESAYRTLLESVGPSEFVGRERDRYALESTVVGLFIGDEGLSELFLDVTPFYAESGGQVGDSGTITTSLGRMDVVDTQSVLGGLIAHRGVLSGEVAVGESAVAVIDGARRDAIRRNHTATHLLHAALRTVLGDHVRQQGSLVAPDRLRFDFSHGTAVTASERERVELLVNQEIVNNDDVSTVNASRVEAESMGAIAFFGDKYGDRVRVVSAGPHSLEFCGGTHVHHLGDIGQVQIVAESSIGANTRRIEAVSGLGALSRFQAMEHSLGEAAQLLRSTPEEVVDAVVRLQERQKELERDLASLRQLQLATTTKEIDERSPGPIAVARLDGYNGDQLRQVAQELLRRARSSVLVVGAVGDGKVALAVATDGARDATALVKELAAHVDGGGGGTSTLALAGGRRPEGIDALMAAAHALLDGGTSR